MNIKHEFTTSGSAVLELIRVAQGEQAGAIFPDVKNWDVAAGVILVREAGGRVTDLEGNDWNLKSQDAFAANGLIHDQIFEVIKR